MQLDIFSLVPNCSSRKLPKCKPELIKGSIVKSDLFFRGKTAKVVDFKQIGAMTLAIVELEFRGSLIQFPCGVCGLEVVT